MTLFLFLSLPFLNDLIQTNSRRLVPSNNLIQINLGPQHPSTHGVLRIIAFVECETIKSVEPELGLLHRGSEKLIEYRC